MKLSTKKLSLLAGAATLAIAGAAWGNGGGSDWDEEDPSPPPFIMWMRAIGGAKAAHGNPAHIASSRIVAIGEGALVSDEDSGHLILADAKGASVAQLDIRSQLALLAFDDVARKAYVADRAGDRVVVVDVGEKSLAIAASWKTPAEPYGVALSPDRKTIYVSTIADRTLVAFDSAGSERWRAPLSPEPRGVAVSPDGTRVVVASLSSGALDELILGERARIGRIALPAFNGHASRGAFTAAFLGEQVVVPFQLSQPISPRIETSDHYGGSFSPPITQHVAYLALDGRQSMAQTNVVEPRAIAWNAERDTMYLAGLASDHLVAVKNATQVDPQEAFTAPLRSGCGADGLAVTGRGSVLVWCSFTRSIERLEGKKTTRGTELVASTMSDEIREGRTLFHSASFHTSTRGAMSCGSCHLDGRADGLSWMIQQHALQTPVLGGRLVGTAPYKWDGKAADLATSLRATIKRLGGDGLSKKDTALLVGFLEQMPAPRTPTRDGAAVARGKTLFESAELGCATCHEGATLTDRETHDLAGTFDTPGLVGLAASAPYFHDGSAPTLEAALRDRGRVHGMSVAATTLRERDLADLVAFLETR